MMLDYVKLFPLGLLVAMALNGAIIAAVWIAAQ